MFYSHADKVRIAMEVLASCQAEDATAGIIALAGRNIEIIAQLALSGHKPQSVDCRGYQPLQSSSLFIFLSIHDHYTHHQ